MSVASRLLTLPSPFTSPFSSQTIEAMSPASSWRMSVASTLFTLPSQLTSPKGAPGVVGEGGGAPVAVGGGVLVSVGVGVSYNQL